MYRLRRALLYSMLWALLLGIIAHENQQLFARTLDAVISDCSNDTQLRNAVNAGGTITFNCGVATLPFGSYMQVSAETVIDGGGKITLDGAGVSAFFQVFSGKKLTLKNLTMRNGRFSSAHPLEIFGDAILEGVTITNNQTGSSGGTVAVFGSLLVKNSTFNANTAASGGSSVAGAAIYVNGGTATIQNSTFTNNSIGGTFGTGGAIHVSGGDATMTNSTFKGNFAPDGGAIYVGESTRVTVTQSLFDGNSGRYGGAIENWGKLQLDASTLANNKALLGDGGGLWVISGDASITNSIIRNNESKTTGGGISCYANTLSVTNSNINNNISGSDGGGIYGGCTVTLSNSTLSGNSAIKTGGAISCSSNNSLSMSKSTLNDNTSGSTGGGIYSACNLNLRNSTLSANHATGSGGGGIYQETAGSSMLSYMTIANNSATFGAGVYNDGAGNSALTIEKSILANNSTGNCDGVVTSLGYNLASDNNCGDFTKTGDQKNVTLALGALSNNGGATATLLPLTGNPAINHIPAASCGFSTDQRDIARPQGTNCDSGAVEVEAVRKVYLPLVRK